MKQLFVALLVFSGVSWTAAASSQALGQDPNPPAASSAAASSVFNADAVNDPQLQPIVTAKSKSAASLRAQILLDRAHFSVGEIDGSFGSNSVKAVKAFQEAQGLDITGVVDAKTWSMLNIDNAPALTRYVITAQDTRSPYVVIPATMAAKASLPALGYSSLLEDLGERFHVSPKLLKQLNPGATFTENEQILVPSIRSNLVGKATRVVVDKSDRTVTAYDANGKILAAYPATIGSQHDPLPIGKWKVNGTARNPPFFYNPKLFWDAASNDTKARIPPGPNNPVGVAWIDLSKNHYGIHGTPEPSKIGYTESHGCIRLTNWDVLELAGLVSPGMAVILQE
jgi:lipoprotein-anchoring transpeptidase ErfK/SrfK